MQDGEYPAQMKIAKVITLYKKGERYKANNKATYQIFFW